MKHRKRNYKRKKIVRKVLGGLFVFVGVIGLFLPIVPGIIIILSGIALINPVFYKKIIKKIKGDRR